MRYIIPAVLLLTFAGAGLAGAAEDVLVGGFEHPPVSAKPQTWWHWMNGNVTREGITADLEAMHRVGIQEANIITVANDIPAGPVPVMSPKFFEMVQFAAQEAGRLGMTLCMDNCPGWSSSGGPWVSPEHAMQFVVSSETRVKGPINFSQVLPQPPTKLNFYRDIAVLAFKTPAGEDEAPLSAYSPKITSSAPEFDGDKLMDGKTNSDVTLPAPSAKNPQQIQLEFPKAVSARSIIFTAGKKCPACSGTVLTSDNGKTFIAIKPFSIPRSAHAPVVVSLGDGPVTAKIFRIEFKTPTAKDQPITLSEIKFSSRVMIASIARKGAFEAEGVAPKQVQADERMKASAEQVLQREGTVNLTQSLKADGTLNWSVPEGEWTILRVGYTPTGVTNHPAPPEATGLECDKLAKEGLDASWGGMMQPLLDKLGPLGGKVMIDCLIDSYETGGQNWTPKMLEEFRQRRGYDMTPFLPALTGRIVDSPEISERFLWDLRRTVADLFAENYFDYFAELCHKHGLKSLVEPYTGPFESLQCGRAADVPMGEFWAGSNGHESVKLASSVGHIYGQSVIGAESFTGAPDHGRWTDDPYSLKALGDKMFCEGINRYIFHRFAHQPWMNRFPGMTMGQWGINLDRTNTWFEKAKPWLDYVTRSQYLLQQGKFVADVAYFCGESTPVLMRAGTPALPFGYDYDSINADVLLKSSVKDGRLLLPDGMSYAVLVLPASDPEITPPLLHKLRQLVSDGLTVVVGEKPQRSPSLTDYPQCDQEVAALAGEMWGDCDGKTVTEHVLGKGKIVSGKPLNDLFTEMKLPVDFAQTSDNPKAQLNYIHRAIDDGDLYFVANHTNAFVAANCTFRVSGKVPELWHSDTGAIETAPVYEEKDGQTTVPLQLDPVGSVFVIFRHGSGGANHVIEVDRGNPAPVAGETAGLVIQKATYESVDGEGSMDVTALVAGMVHDGSLAVTASNAAMGKDPIPEHVKQLRVSALVNGKTQEFVIPEDQQLELPAPRGIGDAPAYELRAGADGAVDVLSRIPISLTMKQSSGKSIKVEVRDALVQNEVSGPWELRFPPNWGAPSSVALDKLISWPQHPNSGVKYFSGTATYLKQLDIPAEAIGQGRALYLNLGTVKNFAQVTLNGKDLGILWKPPFRVDISGAARAGKNELSIAVTNLWPNRIIGDAQLPEDLEWNGMRPAGWPQWLLDGKPSPSGRFTFTTWRHWTKAGQLLESGLIGPVTLEQGAWVKAGGGK